MITLPKHYPNKYYHTDVLSEEQLEFVARNLPEPHSEIGRPAYTNVQLLPGILYVLRSGCRWRDLNGRNYPDGSTHWRRMRYWKRKLKGRPKLGEDGESIKVSTYFGVLWGYLIDQLVKSKKLDTKVVCLDGTLIRSFDFRERVSFSGKHHSNGVKVSVIADVTGIPLGVNIAPGAWNDMKLAIDTIEHMHSGVNLFGSFLLADRGYDSFEFRRYLAWKGLRSNIPKRSSTKGGNKELYFYHQPLAKFRFSIERTNAWLKSFKRLHFRFDKSTYSFECFLYLAIIVICVRRLLP